MMMLNSDEEYNCYIDAEVVLDSWTNCIQYLAFITRDTLLVLLLRPTGVRGSESSPQTNSERFHWRK